MLTITTNKTAIAGIANGTIREWTLPITDFWTKRIVGLLGFSTAETRDIMYNLRENRAGTTDKEHEANFTAGGACSAHVIITAKIGQQDAAECFILTIKNVLDVSGADVSDTERVDGEVVGMANAPAVRVIVERIGFCKYCGQGVTVSVPESTSAADLNEQASQECGCDEAIRQRKRRARMEAAGAWARNIFSERHGQLQVVLNAIRSTFEGSVDYVTVKIGKHTHKIDTDSNGMIRIRSTFRDNNEEQF